MRDPGRAVLQVRIIKDNYPHDLKKKKSNQDGSNSWSQNLFFLEKLEKNIPEISEKTHLN